MNTGFLVCTSDCLDIPNEQLRTIVLPPDPLPVLNARTENFTVDEGSPTSTTLSSDAAQGDIVLSVASVTGFTIGAAVLVQLDNGIYAQEAITNVGASTLTVSIPLPDSASSGALVSEQ